MSPKSCALAAASSAPASSYASSVFSEASYYKQDPASSPSPTPTGRSSSSMAKTAKAWAKELISDLGKPPTQRYDAAQAASSPSTHGTSTVGGPYWVNSQSGKI